MNLSAWKKHWPSLASIGATMVVFLTPSVKAWAGGHPAVSAPILALWAVCLHWAESPVASENPPQLPPYQP